MDFLKQWTFGVCITLIISVIFSLFAPKGRLSSFYKIIISLFIFVSFLMPFTHYTKTDFSVKDKISSTQIYDRSSEAASSLINAKVKQCLTDHKIIGAAVTSDVTVESDEITVNRLTVAVPDEYDTAEVKSVLNKNLSVNAEVIHIGD